MTDDQLIAKEAHQAHLSEALKFVKAQKGYVPFIKKCKAINAKYKRKWADVLYEHRGLIGDFFDYKAAQYQRQAQNAVNYNEMAEASCRACMSVLLRNCAEHLVLSDEFKKKTITALSPLQKLEEEKMFFMEPIGRKLARILSDYLGDRKYQELWDRFKNPIKVLRPFSKTDLQTGESVRMGLTNRLNSEFLNSLRAEKERLDKAKTDELIKLISEDQLLTYYHEALWKKEWKNPEEQQMSCILLNEIIKNTSKLSNDDKQVVCDRIDIIEDNFFSGEYFYSANVYILVQRLSTNFMENVLKPALADCYYPNKDCSTTLMEACVRTFSRK